jgi:hypothetical protein
MCVRVCVCVCVLLKRDGHHLFGYESYHPFPFMCNWHFFDAHVVIQSVTSTGGGASREKW